MSDISIVFDEYISNIRSINAELTGLVLDMLQHVKFDAQKDYLGLMICSFAYKQLEHLKSVHLLIDGGQHRDAQAIARIMMEGFAKLKWASGAPIERSRDWIEYSAVERFRIFYNKPQYTKYKSEIELGLKEHGTKFLKKESKAKPLSEITPDDYITNWRLIPKGDNFNKRSVKDVFKDLGYEEVHEMIYSPLSDWIHWGSLSLQGAISVTDDALVYGTETKHLGVISLAVAFDSLNDTAKLLDDHFKLGYTSRLTKLSKDHSILIQRTHAYATDKI